MKYKYILIDLDDTLLDFKTAEVIAFKDTFKQLDIDPTAELVENYHQINKACWKKLELKLITKEQLATNRFDSLKKLHQLEFCSTLANQIYKQNLSKRGEVCEGAIELMQTIHNYCDQVIAITNGNGYIQYNRLKNCAITPYLDDIIISEDIGSAKPSKIFFDYIFNKYLDMNTSNTIIIGDSLSADILGGNNYNIETIWYNPTYVFSTEIVPTYTVNHLIEVLDILNSKYR